MGYTFVDVDSLEGEGPGGMVRKRPFVERP
jgi:hypothetical protein